MSQTHEALAGVRAPKTVHSCIGFAAVPILSSFAKNRTAARQLLSTANSALPEAQRRAEELGVGHKCLFDMWKGESSMLGVCGMSNTTHVGSGLWRMLWGSVRVSAHGLSALDISSSSDCITANSIQ